MPKRRPDNPHDVYKFLRLWRKKGRYTLKVLAERLEVGISTVSGWETGARQVDLADLVKLAAVYGVHPAALLLAPEEAGPTLSNMQEAGALVKDMDADAAAEWLAVGRRMTGRPPTG